MKACPKQTIPDSATSHETEEDDEGGDEEVDEEDDEDPDDATNSEHPVLGAKVGHDKVPAQLIVGQSYKQNAGNRKASVPEGGTSTAPNPSRTARRHSSTTSTLGDDERGPRTKSNGSTQEESAWLVEMQPMVRRNSSTTFRER